MTEAPADSGDRPLSHRELAERNLEVAVQAASSGLQHVSLSAATIANTYALLALGQLLHDMGTTLMRPPEEHARG